MMREEAKVSKISNLRGITQMEATIRPPEYNRFSVEKVDHDAATRGHHDVEAEEMNRSIFYLDGLGCADCAAKMEREINLLEEVHVAHVDFVSRKMTLETKEDINTSTLLRDVRRIVTRIEPDVTLKADHEQSFHEHHHDQSQTKREWLRLGVGGALFGFALLAPLPESWVPMAYILAYLVVGGPIVFRALKSIRAGQVFNENFLMSVASIGAFLIGEYPEAVAVMLFYLVGELFQDRAVDQSRESIGALMDIRPESANLQRGSELIRTVPEAVAVGDVIVVKPGERIPLDGKVIEGTSTVDTAALTGESMPRTLRPGDTALSGFINTNGVLTIQVSKTYKESTVAKILDLMQNAASRKAPTEQFITTFARYYTPVVVFVAIALAVIPPLILPGALFSDWLYRALVFLVVSCPCALVISIPLSFFGGIGGASKQGILVKGGNYLEALNHVETVVFDKTGTLTKGFFEVVGVHAENGWSRDDLLRFAAYAESYSNHPIAHSILQAYPHPVNQEEIQAYQEIPGKGVSVKVQGQPVLAGNRQLLEEAGIPVEDVAHNGSVVFVAVNQQLAGTILIADDIKDDAAETIDGLKALGIKRIVMLTGDRQSVGERIGKALGISEVYAELLPIDKVEKLETLSAASSEKGKVVFVGDGINDAPVLARADIGVAMGGMGSDAAIEAADVVLMTDEPSKIVTALKMAKRTRVIVMQNIIFALGVKAVVLLLGALGLATMWAAVFADIGVALIAIFNAMRVLNTKHI